MNDTESLEHGCKVVACYGAGNIGRSWALVFASFGHTVRLYDRSRTAAARSLDTIAAGAKDLSWKGLKLESEDILSRIRICATTDELLCDAVYIQESVPESPGAKREAFRDIAALASETAIIASSSSTIPGSQFMDVVRPDRCIVVHPVNPPHVVRAVEIVPSPWTSEETTKRVWGFMKSVGQRPILLRREIFGFLINRLQFAIVNEAFHLIREGICDADAIDTAIRDGLGPRWALYGLFGTSHLNATGGIREYYSKFSATLREILECLHGTPCIPDEHLTNLVANCLERRMPTDVVPDLQLVRDRRLIRLREVLDNTDFSLGANQPSEAGSSSPRAL